MQSYRAQSRYLLIFLFKLLRFLHYGRKERSDGIASQQVRLGRASMTIISYVHNVEISPLRS